MAPREPLTDGERRQIQWAYHKGTEARKHVIQNLFGRQITHASCMAMVDKYVQEAELENKVKAVAKPTEDEMWDWLCCAAFHGNIWSSAANGDPRNWVEAHCQIMGESPLWEMAGKPELISEHVVPPQIPVNFHIRAYKVFTWLLARISKLAASVFFFALGILFERLVEHWIP